MGGASSQNPRWAERMKIPLPRRSASSRCSQPSRVKRWQSSRASKRVEEMASQRAAPKWRKHAAHQAPPLGLGGSPAGRGPCCAGPPRGAGGRARWARLPSARPKAAGASWGSARRKPLRAGRGHTRRGGGRGGSSCGLHAEITCSGKIPRPRENQGLYAGGRRRSRPRRPATARTPPRARRGWAARRAGGSRRPWSLTRSLAVVRTVRGAARRQASAIGPGWPAGSDGGPGSAARRAISKPRLAHGAVKVSGRAMAVTRKTRSPRRDRRADRDPRPAPGRSGWRSRGR